LSTRRDRAADAPVNLLVAGCLFPEDDSDLTRAWTSTAHQVARTVGARVVGSIEGVTVGRSFVRAVIVLPTGESQTLMLNPATRSVAAVAGVQRIVAGAEFVAVPGTEAFVAAGFGVPSPSELSRPLRPRDLVDLDRRDVRQVRHHRPDRVGDVLFNWFD
jgi:hypothetical protein